MNRKLKTLQNAIREILLATESSNVKRGCSAAYLEISGKVGKLFM